MQIGIEPIDLLTLTTNIGEIPADIGKLSQNEITMAQFDETIKKIASAVHKSPEQVEKVIELVEKRRQKGEPWSLRKSLVITFAIFASSMGAA